MTMQEAVATRCPATLNSSPPTPGPAPHAGAQDLLRTLLRATTDTRQQADLMTEAQEKTRTIPRILLVEDNPINQVVAMEFLSLMGVETCLAANGVEALAACAAEAPDLVLMDIQMPGMDGLECARRLRALQAAGTLGQFPILALTAHALDSDIKASLEAGMDEHLTKPLDFQALRQHLARWVKLPS
ncbi:response regulator [Roseateles koreensis]|uniref:Response regulator n=1 Tax=Roseateles koreensis TaxID=2987526 RepID=A0ABT5KPC3_9BURK|nr:response regulator [Roseateles koreensis]MDC8784768.1 response regulator [Roseateles koreensis]